MGQQITTSPDITLLDFAVLYDISGGVPTITLTNQSVGNPSGATNLDQCTWWYEILMPDGTYIHQGTMDSPDVTDDNWTTLEIPEGSWPTPFGVPPYGQIEFDCAVPYRTKLYVKDSDGNIFSLQKATTICRPAGNTEKSLGNFGAANVAVTVKCDIAKIYANDTTNYTYQNRFGTFDSNTWKLAYPMDVEGNDPQTITVEDQGRVIFPVGYSAQGYQLNLSTYATYQMGDSQAIKIQYKFNRVFPVLCNIDLCQLTCEIDKLYKLLPSKCGTVDNPETKDKLLRINTLLGQCFIGINQPLCGIDVPAKIEEIKKIGGFTCNCGVGGGINPIASTDGSINISLDLQGGIEGNVTNTGDNYVIHLEVPGASAGTLQVVTDNGNVTTNSMTSGDVTALNAIHAPSGLTVQTNNKAIAGIGQFAPGDLYGSLYLSAAQNSGGTLYLRPHPSAISYVFTFPQAQGTAGQTMVNDGSGNMTWDTPGAANLQAVTTVGNTTTNSIQVAGIAMPTRTVTTDYSVSLTDYEVRCDVSGGSLTTTLPNVIGSLYCIKMGDTVPSGNTVTIQVTGGGTIDGASSYVMRVPNQAVIVKRSATGAYSIEAQYINQLAKPTITPGPGMGTGAIVAFQGTAYSDKGGVIVLQNGTPSVVTTETLLFTVAYSTNYTLGAVAGSAAIILPANEDSSQLASSVYVINSATSGFAVYAKNPSLILGYPGHLYSWRFLVNADQL